MAAAVLSAALSLSLPMPAVLDRIARCETQANPTHATRDFISMFGIYRPSWNEYRPAWVRRVASRGYDGEPLPSVFEQRAVALEIARKAGLSAWGCWREYGWVKHG